jgi:hypothetical protein
MRRTRDLALEQARFTRRLVLEDQRRIAYNDFQAAAQSRHGARLSCQAAFTYHT